MATRLVLVVDDNRAMRALIRSLLEQDGSTVLECETGEAALDLYTRHHPDWVLMDMKLAGMDGIEATRAIVARDRDARVLIVTEQDESYRAAAAAAGARGFLSKERLLDLPGLLGR